MAVQQDMIDALGAAFIGKNGAASESALQATFPGFHIHVLPDGAIVTMDFRTDRIRVWCDQTTGAILELEQG